jgi:citrate lyase subunit beta/citryl-CoA lyase
VELSSSKPAVISAEGKVTKPEYDTKVTLTVKVTEGEAIGTAEKVVTVPGEKGPNPDEPQLDKTALEAAIKEAEKRGSGVIAVNGKMVDRPVVIRAQRTIDLAIASGIMTKEDLA